MSMTYLDLQEEVKRRATRDQSGGNYDTAVKNLINGALFRIAGEAPWKQLRRNGNLYTVGEFSTGTVACNVDSTTWTFTGANLITNGIQVGRRIKLTTNGGSGTLFKIDKITGENSCTTKLPYDGTANISGASFKILGQEVYNLPIQCGRTAILWHEAFGYPYVMYYLPEREFMSRGYDFDTSDIPEMYRMWGEDWTINQPRNSSVITVSSSNAADNAQITVFGTVSGYPDYEVITLNGVGPVSGTKVFSEIERIAKSESTVGRVTVTSDSQNTTIAVIPVGDTTAGVQYQKVQIFPPPQERYYLNVLYYKQPFRLVNNNDVHELGQDFDELIIMLATARLDGEQSKKDVGTFASLYKDELRILRRKNADKLDWLPRLDRPEQARWMRGRYSRYFGPNRNLGYQQIGSKYGPSSYYRW